MKDLVYLFNRNHFLRTLLNTVTTSFLILFTLPVFVYYLNLPDLSWDGLAWFILFLKSTIFCFIIALIISTLKSLGLSIAEKLLTTTILTTFIYVLIRTFFLPIPVGVLDGAEIPDVPPYADDSMWLTAFIFFLMFLAAWKYRKIVEDILQFSSFAIVLLSIYILQSINHVDKNDYTDKKDGPILEYTKFSKNSNVIVISFDALQNDLVNEILSEDRELRKVLDGFKSYTDVVGYGPNTHYSMTSTLLSKYYPTGVKGDEIEVINQRHRNDTVFEVLSRHDYNVDNFNAHCGFRRNMSCTTFPRILSPTFSESKLTAFDVSILRVIPKSISWQLIQNLSNQYNSTTNLIMGDKKLNGQKMEIYAFRKMYKDAYLVEAPVFKFHHYLFSHQPVRFRSDCSYDALALQTWESARSENSCIFKEFSNFISKLKELGIYDESFIIFTSDHGYDGNIQPLAVKKERYHGGFIVKGNRWSIGRYWPVLMVKPQGSRGELTFDDSPASLVDIIPTIYSFLGVDYCKKTKCDGINLLAQSDSKNRKRQSMFYVGGTLKNNNTKSYYSADVFGDYSGVADAMIELSLISHELECFQTINFSEESEKYIAYGLSDFLSWGRYSDGHNPRIVFKLDNKGCSKNTLSLKIREPQNAPTPKVKVILNDVEIGEIIIEKSDQILKTFSFNIPTNLINNDRLSILDFKIENPYLAPDETLLGVGFESMVFQ